MIYATKSKPDSGWAWIVLASSFSLTILFGGVLMSFGVFYLEFLDEFNQGKTMTSWLGSILGGMSFLPGALVSMLANRLGCHVVTTSGVLVSASGFFFSGFAPNLWVMLVTYGAMGGFGLCCILNCSGAILPYYFVKRRSLALGIMLSGVAVGTAVGPVLVQWLLGWLPWRQVFMVLGAVLCVGSLLGLTFRPVVDGGAETGGREQRDEREVETKILDVTIFRSPAVNVLYVADFLNRFIGFYLPYFFLPDYALESGFTAQAGALLVTIAGASSFVARVISGYVSDKPFADPPKICGILLVIGGAATVAAPFMTSYVMLCVYSVFLGLSFGTHTSLAPSILVGFVGKRRMSNAFGFMSMFRGLAVLAGTPLARLLISLLGGYLPVFIIAGISIAVSGLMIFPLSCSWGCMVEQSKVDKREIDGHSSENTPNMTAVNEGFYNIVDD